MMFLAWSKGLLPNHRPTWFDVRMLETLWHEDG